MCRSDASAFPVETASKEQRACQNLVQKILSERLWLTGVSSVAEVRMPRSCCQFRTAAWWACVLFAGKVFSKAENPEGSAGDT